MSPSLSPKTMETISVSTLIFIVIGLLITRWAWKFMNWVWIKPKRLEKKLRQQGFKGNSYRFLVGDLKDITAMLKEAKSKPINLNEDITSRVYPFPLKTIKDYGKDSFVWIGPTPRVHICNPEDLKDIFTKIDNFPKPKPTPITKWVSFGLSIYNGEKWAKHRKIINPVFYMEKLKLMVPAFAISCNEMLSKWERQFANEKESCEIDVWPNLQDMSADVISRTAFGSSYSEGQAIFQLLREQGRHFITSLSTVHIPGWRFLPTKLSRRMKEIDNEIGKLLKGIIHKREMATAKSEATDNDLLGILMESNRREIMEHDNNKGDGMNMKDVIEECKLFYIAGQETTSVLLVWTLILLSKFPNWQSQAREEVLSVFGNNKPDSDGLAQLKVVTMILYEVLRLYPPLVILLRAIEKETQLRNFTLPAGVNVVLPTVLMHYDTELWGDDAHEFKPERFAEGVSKATNGRVCFFPFGWGPRICIGNNFALLEAKLALALILQRFSFELSPSYTHAPTSGLTLHPQHGAHLILHKL